ncbi:hypothetical protein CR532_05285 (plasmid) [Candidatus Borreliella tachyglossi]|uniref:DUF2634 domain-containing protein n=1 Tax=Candidatus Borreliella tachyglossi TaxID=1964448 RepID=A0A2S1LYH0_9SPIR|nr:hypothetical protein [Candidatus Borreliella tachyglossi]AWG43348.1 hypothetical protein CR532_04945 [Candidatus Borreliella tachyglossi]AWG43409.1 hypothetical protein CR532_05285 [Candidatus Borreliella tachyglossi]
MDLKINDKFDLVFGSDLMLVDTILEQKQRLFLFLKIPKGSLQYAPHHGFEYMLFLRFCKIGNLEIIKTYFLNIAQELKIDLVNVEATFNEGCVRVEFYFVGDTLVMDFAV